MNKTVKKIIRLALLVLALINIILSSLGLSPIELDSEVLTNFINDGWVVAMALWNTWKNFSVTDAHLKADELAWHIKRGAEVVIQYQQGGEGMTASEIDHEADDPEDAQEV